ncbi:MAG: hypothetical protein H5U26_00705 [Immundisolibacter sp.]|uniref:hypothetical protein n=1 Tax=Immundisolibacter sp. TaxID=1934948 RepID=UPI00199BAB7B|nr:hypothetical protein [Immundisolibacter sp.]MBC7160615.1 hypothetical protein [Immundisolibacter sp.]
MSTTTNADEFPVTFECQRHVGALRLTPAACAAAWTRARRNAEADQIRLEACRGCPVGAGHAGVKVRPLEAPAQATASVLSCVRCGRSGARRLVGSRLCVSCYNRQREYEAGRNGKGGPCSHHVPLYCATVGAITEGGDVRPLRVDAVSTHLEALLTIARATGTTTFGRVPPGAPSAPYPAMPRRQAVFALLKTPG